MEARQHLRLEGRSFRREEFYEVDEMDGLEHGYIDGAYLHPCFKGSGRKSRR